MKQIADCGKKGRLPVIIFISGIMAGSCAIMAHNHKTPEDTQAYAEPEHYTRAMTYQSVSYTEYDVPAGDTAFKSYMSYKAITNTKSDQYKLQQKCWTDKNGLRRYDGDKYVIALGTYYADSIGEEFRITLDTGKSFNAVVGDFKADRHTDALNQYTPMENRKCVVEFVVDTPSLDKTAKRMGDISYIKGFNGNVEKIENVSD